MHHASSLKLTAFALILGATLGLAAPGVGAQSIMERARKAAEEARKKSEKAKKKTEEEARQKQGQQGQRGQTSPPAEGRGSLSSALGATDARGWTDYSSCMASTAGHQEKLTAEVLQRKLAQSPNLSAQERRNIEEDIQWLNATAAGARNLPQPDPKHPHRWLLVLTDEEQMEINKANMQFANEVRAKCEAQYGGMSQFADPSGRRRAQADSGVNAPVPVAPAPTGPSRLEEFNNCTASRQGLRWKVMADRLEAKLAAAKNLSAQERTAWEEDIAVVRAAAQSGATTTPMSPDPKNPMRYMTRLTGEDHMAVIQEYNAASQALLARCSAAARTDKSAVAGGAPQSGGLVPSPDNPNAQSAQRNAPQRQAAGGSAAGGSLSAALGATRADYLERSGLVACYDRTKGHMAKVTADTLEAKLKTAQGLTPQQRQLWNEDIAAWRAAEAARAEQPIPPDPNNPYRWQSYFTRAERQEINRQHSAFVNKIVAECNAMDHMGTGEKKR